MYCKFVSHLELCLVLSVLIVAKCIVNIEVARNIYDKKYVLIVAKCIVNKYKQVADIPNNKVLIVAKCIVNLKMYLSE